MRTSLRGALTSIAIAIAATGALADDTDGRRDDPKAKKLPTPLPQAHAHNDYEHRRPLLDALDHGFSSVEADIFLVKGKLLVAHDFIRLRPERTLEKLYLDPLLARVRRHGGGVYPSQKRAGDRGAKPAEFTLLIDIKDNGEKTYAALHALLASKYAEMLTTVRDGKVQKKAVTIVISGNRPRRLIAGQKVRYAGVDGRLSDLDSKEPAHLLPLISDRWSSHFKWRGNGEIPAVELAKLRDVVRKSHGKGRRVRFWATPEKIAVWAVLRDNGVDLINTDDLAGLEKFLRSGVRRF